MITPPSKITSRQAQSATARLVSPRSSAFTLIELLVVIAIIVILAGLGFSGVSGALKTARKAEVRAMANQIKLGITAYYAEYGTYPRTVAGNSDTPFQANTDFLRAMMGSNNVASVPNRRGIRFLEVPAKFTNSSGIVTPAKFYSSGQRQFNIVVDGNYDGRISVANALTNASGSVAVWVPDPDTPTKFIGTW